MKRDDTYRTDPETAVYRGKPIAGVSVADRVLSYLPSCPCCCSARVIAQDVYGVVRPTPKQTASVYGGINELIARRGLAVKRTRIDPAQDGATTQYWLDGCGRVDVGETVDAVMAAERAAEGVA